MSAYYPRRQHDQKSNKEHSAKQKAPFIGGLIFRKIVFVFSFFVLAVEYPYYFCYYSNSIFPMVFGSDKGRSKSWIL